ncbi:cytidylyltransferase domain-containing protein [Pseudodesulfovibrio methanolicus]|uniref:Acylneuraminate cytidylyltransferase n=1 Tax=Pseudodesulfovibrio methanolicus TaxID=3126690 RepID=A0ABZ2IYY2_9BACT
MDPTQNAPEGGKAIIYIPARANSSRLPGKALADLGGHPLIAYTVRVAKAIKGVDHVLVDTDSPAIREAALEYGAEVPFLRDRALAGDKTSLDQTVNVFMERVREVFGPVSKKISMLPTSPFRNVADVQELVDALENHLSVETVLATDSDLSTQYFVRDGEVHSLLEVSEYNPLQYHWIKGLGYFHAYYMAGTSPRHLWLYNNFKYHVLTNPVELIDIDTLSDLEVARRVMDANLYDFGMEMQ